MSQDVRYSSAPTRRDQCAVVVLDTFTREYYFYRQCRNTPEKGTRVCRPHFLTNNNLRYYRADPNGEPDDNVEDHLGQDALLRLQGQMASRFTDGTGNLRAQIRELSRELDNREHEIRGLNDQIEQNVRTITQLTRIRDRARQDIDRLNEQVKAFSDRDDDCATDQADLTRTRAYLEQSRAETQNKVDELEALEDIQNQLIASASELESEYNGLTIKLRRCRQIVSEYEEDI